MRDDPLGICGKELNGRYLVERQLGAGGMGVVYEAVQLGQGAPCAVKLIRPELGLSAHADELLRRFRREAKLGGRLQHEGLVQVFDLDQLPDGTLFYAMELLSGRSAADLLVHGGALPWELAVELGRQAAEALVALHEARLVHRDLKPENLQVLEDGRVKVLDLGVAHMSAILSSDAEEPTDVRTRTGHVLGTPAYMAPEQLEDSRRVDGRADVYALGLVIYELCSGLQPFRGRRFEEVLQLKFLRRPVPPLRQGCPAAPAALERLLASTLGARDERPRMAALAAALARLPREPREVLQRRLAERLALIGAPEWAQPTLPAPPPAAARAAAAPARSLEWPPRRARLATLAGATALGGVGGLILLRAVLGPLEPAARPAAAAVVPVAAAQAPQVAVAVAPAVAAPAVPATAAQRSARVDRAPPVGRLRIAVRPFAEIYIDGQHRPEGSPHTYALTAGRHRVRAINTALGQDETRTILVSPRGQAEVAIDWEAP